MAISNALLPVVSNSYSNKNYSYTKYKIKQAITISLIIGVPCTLAFMTFPEYILNLIYNTNEGLAYIKIIAPMPLTF
jgi:stage V sporulation protein B